MHSALLLLFVFYLAVEATGQVEHPGQVRGAPPENEELARIYCSTCHSLPAPSLLVRSNWLRGALPRMAPFLGLARSKPDAKVDPALAKVFPETPLISKADWDALVHYYVSNSPESLPPQKPVTNKTTVFSQRVFCRSPDAPCTTLLRWDSSRRSLFIGDAQTQTLKVFDANGKLKRAAAVDSAPVALANFGEKMRVSLIGRIFPSDEPIGQVWEFGDGERDEPTRLLQGLRRPADISRADLDGDTVDDLIVCSFGNHIGRLSWFRAERAGYSEHVLSDTAGSVRCIPHDWNGDGAIDLLVLRAQGREGADLYVNKGKGEFNVVPLWDDPPSYGNAALELADLDGDGRPELLVCNGDNGDFPCAPKQYHGVRIFSVTRDLKAELRYTFHTPGAYGAKAADFDGDGRLDIAAISFFPDYKATPDNSVFLLHNEGNWEFTPSVVPGSEQGRWLIMETGDVDGDGDTDVLLGSFSRGPLSIPIPKELSARWESEKCAVLLLENITKLTSK